MADSIIQQSAATREALALLLAPGQVVELRAIKMRGERGGHRHNEGGYFDTDHLDAMARVATRVTRTAKGVYWTLNPINEQLLARAAYEIDYTDEAGLTKDQDIMSRQWLLVDCDPVKDAHISATDAEKEQACTVIAAVRAELTTAGWPSPIYADSGNGYHLLYRVELPADDAGLIKRCLEALAAKHNTPTATVDVKVYNPARICKIPGTWARKGSSTVNRPHRQGRLLDVPGSPQAIPILLLEALAGPPGEMPDTGTGTQSTRSRPRPIPPADLRGPRRPAGQWEQEPGRLDVERWLRDRGVPHEVSYRRAGDRTIYLLEVCPFDATHRSPDAAIMQDAAGQLSAQCFHNSCRGRGWAAFRDVIGRPTAQHYEQDGGRCGSASTSSHDANIRSASPAPSAPPSPPNQFPNGDAQNQPPPTEFSNFTWEQHANGSVTPQGSPVRVIFQQLMALGRGWPQRVDGQLFVPTTGIEPDTSDVQWLTSSTQLFAWIGHLLPAGNRNELQWARGRNMATQGELYEYARSHARPWNAIERYPHAPTIPNHYYLHQPLTGGNGVALGRLLDRFCPATEQDRQLILAFFLSLIWGGMPGQRPAWVFTAPVNAADGGRGYGKSKIAELGSRLVGGCIRLSASEKLEDIHKRLLSPSGISRRVALLDNVKTLRFSWAELESIITADTISGRQMYTGEGRRPNTLTWVITFNGAQFSRDLSQRCVIVHLGKPTYTGDWEGDTVAFIEGNRWAILGDLVELLHGPSNDLRPRGRWGAWECQVLGRVRHPAECQDVILARQGESDDEQNEIDIIRTAFAQAISLAGGLEGHDPDTSIVLFTSEQVALIVNNATGERRPTNKAVSYLKMLSVPEISTVKLAHRNMTKWQGKFAKDGDNPLPIFGNH